MSNLPNPGETVRVECIQVADLTVTEAARWLRCSRPPLTHILNDRAAVSSEMTVAFELEGGSNVTGQSRPSFHCWSLVDSLLDFVHRGIEYEDERSEWFESTSAPHCERMGEIGLAFRTGGSNAKGFLFVAGRVTEHLRSLEA